ncbi:uncharacterized protein LOC113390126 [Ctenocephalides felis]|uniref:uncharacterized protein LOC113390126 n=1 Tax=Ctenocephalides felis TaxID=7515 RepID=UPI000E6E2A45|nr:uncharacterized protein LOC113390126 [Ctenocephalides felis]
MIEAHFNRSRIKTEDVKYEFILSYLDDKLASEVEDIILNPPKVEPYTKLKKEIIQRLSQSQDQKIRRLLQQEELGDRKPSQFLRHLTSLAGPLLDENILRTLWLQRLPTHTQQILKAHPTMKIEDLAAIADSIGEVNIGPTVAATSLTDGTTSELLKRVEDLTKMIAELQNRRPRFRHNSRSRKISRTRSFSRQRNVIGKDLIRAGTTLNMETKLRNARNHAKCRETKKTGTKCGKCLSSTFTPHVHLRQTNQSTIFDRHRRRFSVILQHNRRHKEFKTSRRYYNLQVKTINKGTIQKGSIKTVNIKSKFSEIFKEFPSLTRPPGLPRQIKHTTVHYIKTSPGPPVVARTRPLKTQLLKIAKQEFEEMVQLGTARPSSSSWSSPLHLVQKKDDAWRPCGDYRALNARTIPDRYPVRLMSDYSQHLSGCNIFSIIDLKKAYQQIPVYDEDIPKTAITTPFGLFEFPFMTFGLRNAAQTFQRFMDEVTSGLDFCFPYIDDILIASKSEEQHETPSP